nr:abnormal spindle-like microcephaly-associated protein homolog [Anolis sagrei ordinatus]
METFEDHTWCSHSYHSGDDDDDDDYDGGSGRHPLVKIRSRSNSRSRHNNQNRRRSSFLVDELDMLMDKAATTIQAAYRGHLTRNQLKAEHAAASTIQAAWRHFITREYLALQRGPVPSDQMYGRRRRTPSLASLEDVRVRRPRRYSMEDRDHAAEVIQAHYRGYVTRKAICECRNAAVTIQAHWRGYQTRQELAQRGYPPPSPQKRYYTPPTYVPGSTGWMGPYPRKHWRKVMVGEPEEWASKGGRAPIPKRQKDRLKTTQPKVCPQCGHCTGVRVLVGVGKGPPSESDRDDECEGRIPRRCRPKRLPTKTSKSPGPASRAHHYRAQVSYQTSSRSYYSNVVSDEQHRRQGRDPQRLTPGQVTTSRITRERTTGRSFSSTSLQQPAAPSPGTSEWLYENYCARRMGEGQRRVFKTRKQIWQVARAATLIQSFWRGWKVRRAIAAQQAAATTIQSAYRGYKTRVYLIEAGVLSEGDTE